MDWNSLIPFGRFKVWRLIDIPAQYFITAYENGGLQHKELDEWIKENIEVLREKAKEPPPKLEEIILCDKIAYPTEKEAKFKLKYIRGLQQNNKKPIRCYECPKCGAWHLTSKPLVQYK